MNETWDSYIMKEAKKETTMLYTNLTRKAMRVSFEAHKNQVDKDNIPYVYHPYEVASRMEDEESVCVALLHDVVEDTDMTFEELGKMGFTDSIIEALKLLTHKDGVPYMEYVEALSVNPIARRVKMSDLTHNMNRTRRENITQQDEKRWAKYQKAYDYLANCDN